MGSSMNTQLVTISSQTPTIDADALSATFCHTEFSREALNNESIVLIGLGLCTFIILKGVPGTTPQVLAVSGKILCQVVLDSNSLARVVSCQRLAHDDDMTTIAVLELPGSFRIILTTPFVLESKLGREAVVQAISSCAGDSISSVKNNDIAQNGKAIMEPEQDTEPHVETPPNLPDFPTLDVSLLSSNDSFEVFPVNSTKGIPFETDLFVGSMMLILRPEDPTTDPYWNERLFSKRKRRFVFQLQGKFKRKPRGIIYAGAEISEQMKLGLVAKGMCSILLNLIRSFNSNMHYSFGDKKQDEQSHIVIPAWNFFERLTVTKAGETPPPMGDAFPESQENITARKASVSGGDWNTEDTYSMSYYSMYIDLPKWKIVSLPIAPDIDLRTFWNSSFLKIVLYENETPTKDDRHLTKDNSYFFGLKMAFHPDGKKQEAEASLPWNLRRRINSESNLSVSNFGDEWEKFDNESTPNGEPTIIEESDGEEFYFDAEEADDSERPSFPTTARLTGSVGPTLCALAKIDSSCPLSIDMCSKGKYVTVYAFINADGNVLFRTLSTVEGYFNLNTAKKSVESTFSPRLATAEKARRIVGEAYVTAQVHSSSGKATKLLAFQKLKTDFDVNFLRRQRPQVMLKLSRVIQKSSFVARAHSDHHWVEEWVKVSEHQIAFYHPERLNDSFRMTLSSIVKVEIMSAEESPNLKSFAFLAIETLGRTLYLMFASKRECEEWCHFLTEVTKSLQKPIYTDRLNGLGSAGSKESFLSDHLMSVDDPTEEFLHKSSMWACKQRRILNCKSFCFTPRSRDPIATVQDTLLRALEPREDSEYENLRSFLHSASLLKEVNVNGLSERDRIAFFLNLYHVMIMHAFLVLGPPNSSFQCISYFNTISYQCSDEIFSLTELEHNIIRASMNYPSNFVSKFVLPKSQFRFALTQSDFRINFALNCGSVSNPGSVPIYKSETLEEQLDTACRAYLDPVATVIVKRGQTILTLPRICQWFTDDFGTYTQMIQKLQKFLKWSDCRLINATWSSKEEKFIDLNTRYLNYSFECRNLTLRDDSAPFMIE